MVEFFYIIPIFILFLCVGSFLNVLSHRITFDKSLLAVRSMCPHCDKVISWYDNIPVISFIILGGKCRNCKGPISFLYPFIELLSGTLFTLLYLEFFADIFIFKNSVSLVEIIGKSATHLIFFGALICSTRSDLEAMVIPQIFTLWLVPFGIIFSYFNFTNTDFYGSILGAICGYGILWVVAAVFKKVRKKEGLGVGDMELLALIGSFLGPLGVWTSLMLGSISGLIIGGGYLLLIKKDADVKIPFGPFLALGAVLHVFFNDVILSLF